MIEVLKTGLETAIQDWPGRHGYWNQGFPVSGPMDSWSMRMANVLVGNEPGSAALEAQIFGPALRFTDHRVIAVCGADMKPTLDDEPIPLWESIEVKPGQVLKLGAARSGARSYIAVSGGFASPIVLGSRSTFAKAGVGGVDDGPLVEGQQLPLFDSAGTPGLRVPPHARPTLSTNSIWEVEVCAGPNDDWIDEAGKARFLEADWKLSPKSDRTGYRLEGPEWTFSEKAYDKRPENGALPSNIIDHGYPMGAINLAGQTPIILMNDGPSMGGFINPYTIPSAAFWKLGQAKAGDTLRFREILVEDAQAVAMQLIELCKPETLTQVA